MAFASHGLTHRSTVTATRGMVSSAHPLASVAGLRILMQGGNAIDAAAATAAALNVVEPYMSGIAGVGYMHVYSADNGTHQVLDYVGLTPAQTRLSLYQDERDSIRGPLAVLVPGACGGWAEALQRLGSMPLDEVFRPAIEYAERGFALTVKNHAFFAGSAADLQRFPASVSAFLPQGTAPLPGSVLIQADLARTLRMIAEGGAEVFYQGALADRMVDHVQQAGGVLTKDDLRQFRPVWVDPVHADYRGWRIYAPPPPCQAIQILQTMGIMEGYELAAMGHNTVDTLHRFIEATKLAMADRIRYAAVADPPTAALLDRRYTASRRALITGRAQYTGGERYTPPGKVPRVEAGDPGAQVKQECTTHFDVIDDRGNAVAVTQSLGTSFGSAMVVPGTGVLLNGFMRWFDLEPQSPNVIGPAKKNEMCLSPVQVWDDAGLRLLIGTPGSYGILQTTPQMLMNVLDHGMNVQAAIEAPRVKTGRPGFAVDVETRIPAAVLTELEKRGHDLTRLGDWHASLGGGQAIAVDPESGAFMGGADPRRDGYALGW